MADLPEASISIDDEAGAFAGGTGYAIVMGCVQSNADLTPRVFASTKALLEQHGYSAAADYVALHIEATQKPVIFVGLPTATAAALQSVDSSGKTGSSNISISAGSSGYLDEIDGVITVVDGGTIGTDQITFLLSCDGGRSEKLIRLGTATSYTIPYVGAVISFAAGTLVADDEFKFRTTAPMWDSAGLATAKDALAAQLKQARSFVVIGDLANSTFAGYVTTEANAYETENDRFVFARVSLKDRMPLAKVSKAKRVMKAGTELTFAEVGATGDTITRTTGSWVTEGYAVGDLIDVSGTASNNFTNAKVTGVSATVLTLDTQDLVAEVTSAATVVGSPELLFAEVGATGDTITRSSGSFITDGIAVGDLLTISGTASNNVTTDAITAVSATVLTLGSTDLVAESIASHKVTIEKTQTKSAWVAALASGFASVDSQKRIDLGIGRARKQSPITQWLMRRPVSWAASIREYSHDIHIPTWRKSDGPLDGWDLEDGQGNVVEFDDRVDGGGLANRFTCFRTWANGPDGAFIAMSLTRASEGSLLSRTHNMAVANLACTVCQAETENAIGQVLVLKSDGKGTENSLAKIEERVNSALEMNLLQDKGEGQRASKATWRASRNDVLNVTGATLNGTLTLLLNGTLEKIQTRVRIQTAG